MTEALATSGDAKDYFLQPADMNNEATPAADLDVYSILLQSLTTVYTNSGYSLVRMKILSR